MDVTQYKSDYEKIVPFIESFGKMISENGFWDRYDELVGWSLDDSIGLNYPQSRELSYLQNLIDSYFSLIECQNSIDDTIDLVGSMPEPESEPDETDNETEENENGVNG